MTNTAKSSDWTIPLGTALAGVAMLVWVPQPAIAAVLAKLAALRRQS